MESEDVLEKAKKIAKKYRVRLEVRFIDNDDSIDVKIFYESLRDLQLFMKDLSENHDIGLNVYQLDKPDISKRDLYN